MTEDHTTVSHSPPLVRWWCTADGRVSGPYNHSQVISYVRTGHIGLDTEVCPEGSQNWKALSEWPQFASLRDAAPLQLNPTAPRPEPLPISGPIERSAMIRRSWLHLGLMTSLLVVVTSLLIVVIAFWLHASGSGEGADEAQATESSDQTFEYGRAIVAATKKIDLNGKWKFSDAAKRCRDLAVEISRISTRDVDPFFVTWADDYTSLLLEMSNCCDAMAQRGTDAHQIRRFVESFERGRRGDPFGVALEEMSVDEQQQLVIKTFETRHLELMLKFQRRFNAIAPEGVNVSVGDNK